MDCFPYNPRLLTDVILVRGSEAPSGAFGVLPLTVASRMSMNCRAATLDLVWSRSPRYESDEARRVQCVVYLVKKGVVRLQSEAPSAR